MTQLDWKQAGFPVSFNDANTAFNSYRDAIRDVKGNFKDIASDLLKQRAEGLYKDLNLSPEQYQMLRHDPRFVSALGQDTVDMFDKWYDYTKVASAGDALAQSRAHSIKNLVNSMSDAELLGKVIQNNQFGANNQILRSILANAGNTVPSGYTQPGNGFGGAGGHTGTPAVVVPTDKKKTP